MDDVKKQVVDRLKQANNVLVTVRNNPSIDLLSACIGLALVLDKLDKHTAAVFSGDVPSAIEFLKPEETLEDTPDSLRDFIIALDKSKADKLRYKVEDKVVRIFITPYRTSLSQDDLQFSQGDFNIDVVVALGVHEQQELDQAVMSHGRILHDATVVTINNTPNGNLGALNWQDTGASSLSEMVAQLVDELGKDKKILDEQISTALLTGIVAETERFSNDKTTPKTMGLAGELMAAGANQQLVANKLQEGGASMESSVPKTDAATLPPTANAPSKDDGALEIPHQEVSEESETTEGKPTEEHTEPDEKLPEPTPGRTILPMAEPNHISGVRGTPQDNNSSQPEHFADVEVAPKERSFLVDEPPMKQVLPAELPAPDPATAYPFNPSILQPPAPDTPAPVPIPTAAPASSAPPVAPVLPVPPAANPVPAAPDPTPTLPVTPPTPFASSVPVAPVFEYKDETLEKIEESVDSPHLEAYSDETEKLDDARSRVLEALQTGPQPLTPRHDLNANPLGDGLHASEEAPAPPASDAAIPTEPPVIEVDQDGNMKPAAVAMPALAAPAPAEPLPDTDPSAPPALDMPLPSVMPTPAAAAAPAPVMPEPPRWAGMPDPAAMPMPNPSQAGPGMAPPPNPPPLMPPSNFSNEAL